jgi:hypothetical protein
MSQDGPTGELGERDGAPETVTVVAPDERLAGRAVDLREGSGPGSRFDPSAVAAAVRSGNEAGEENDEGIGSVVVDCPAPRAVHEHVGVVESGMGLRARTALAAAARSRGLSAPQDDELASVRADLADVEVPETDAVAARERLAGTESAVVAARERVAELRGRVQAAREAGRETAELRDELAAAARELSERETERAAAREACDRAERRAREARDARERRRRLEDRAANLERDARAHLVDACRPEYARALAAVPGRAPSADGDPFDADPVPAALAVARVARLRAPVVLAVDRFESARAAADWLDAPVIRV